MGKTNSVSGFQLNLEYSKEQNIDPGRERAVTVAADETVTQRLYSVLQMVCAKFSTERQGLKQALVRKGEL